MQPALSFQAWRDLARPLLVAGISPDVAVNSIESAAQSTPTAASGKLSLPARLMQLLESISCYRVAGRYELMYRLAWRALYENPKLLEDAADPDVRRATQMAAAIRRDVHKMHAFVRFREIPAEGAEPTYFAWFEPEHEILRRGAVFFVKRFPNMRWTIATPAGSALWNRTSLEFLDAPALDAKAARDAHEDLWRLYYRSICNVARINPSAMKREMPQKYWKNLPEAAEIGALLHNGWASLAHRQDALQDRQPRPSKAVRDALTHLTNTSEGPQACRRCEIWRHATQAVSGEGPRNARIMLVGEQPGNEEDLRGQMFVGPAGAVLERALISAALVRAELYITNAVKHFKWEPRGKRRLHKKPDVREIDACNVWLEQEIGTLKAAVIVALGATALRALTGSTLSIDTARRQHLSHASGARIITTYHPSAVLRAEGPRAEELFQLLTADLRQAAQLARSAEDSP
jgi:probable DNA metabolism protein